MALKEFLDFWIYLVLGIGGGLSRFGGCFTAWGQAYSQTGIMNTYHYVRSQYLVLTRADESWTLNGMSNDHFFTRPLIPHIYTKMFLSWFSLICQLYILGGTFFKASGVSMGIIRAFLIPNLTNWDCLVIMELCKTYVILPCNVNAYFSLPVKIISTGFLAIFRFVFLTLWQHLNIGKVSHGLPLEVEWA